METTQTELECMTMTLPRLAELLGMSSKHVYRMAKAGKEVKVIRLGHRVVVSKKEAERLYGAPLPADFQ